MAKRAGKPDPKATTKKTAKKVTKAPKDAGAKYGIKELAALVGTSPAGVRVKLRREGVEKEGGRYGWDTKAELAEVAEIISKPAPKKKGKGEDDE